jgi:hypothetical protein
MSLVNFIAQDQYVSRLNEREQIVLNLFDGIVQNLRSDLEQAEQQKTQSGGDSSELGQTLGALDLKLDVKRSEDGHAPSTFILSSAYSEIRFIANNPPGWVFIQVSKSSAMFEGVLQFGLIEVVLHAQAGRPFEYNFVRLAWLWSEGMPDKDRIRPRLIVDQLWKHLLNPQVLPQLEEFNKRNGQ